jgi:magnesium chelatase family protein
VIPPDNLAGWAAVGEFGLDGQIAPVVGALPAAVAASAMGLGLICPEPCGPEAAWVGDCRLLVRRSLINPFRGQQVLSPTAPGPVVEGQRALDLKDVKVRRQPSARSRSPPPAATTSCSSARRVRASP